jgi:tetratricopeptide (TPR) repeat protein
LTLGRRTGRSTLVAEALELFRIARGDRDLAPSATLRLENESGFGRALRVLGELEDDPGLLKQSVGTLRALCDDPTITPLDRAKTLEHLGSSLRSLGDRASSVELLTAATAAFREALTDDLRTAEPQRWAQIQTNLGNALARLASRGDPRERVARYGAAIKALDTALELQSREANPGEWARSKTNVANVLVSSVRSSRDQSGLLVALGHYREALEFRTEQTTPLSWARTQCGIGFALVRLGARSRRTERLYEALQAFSEALRVLSRERAPHNWAQARHGLGHASLLLGVRLGDLDNLLTAEAALNDAIALIPEVDRPWTRRLLSRVAKAKAHLEDNTAMRGD